MSKRPAHAMPDDDRAALRDRGVEADYRARPRHQRNDYLGWIGGARQDGPRAKRIARMAHGPSVKA